MDPFAQLLDGPRAADAFVVRAVFEPPFGIEVNDDARLTVVAMATGGAWLRMADEPPRHLAAGDVALVRWTAPYIVSDPRDAVPGVEVLPGGACQARPGVPHHEHQQLGVRTWGNQPGGSTVMLVGTYPYLGQVAEQLLGSLPDAVVVRGGRSPAPFVGLLGAHMVQESVGQQVVLDRLLDLVLVETLRRWFDDRAAEPPPWYAALADPVVGRVLRVMHDRFDQEWTVDGLASEIGVSRASLARRFVELVGQTPMRYLRGWRMAIAADLLRDSDLTVAEVARRVGYHSPFTFSAAYKRHFGVSPSDHRTGDEVVLASAV